MRTILPSLISLVAATLSAQAYALVPPPNVVCSDPGTPIQFDVSFNGLYENAIIIKQAKTGRTVMSFNNYFQNGATGSWESGAGRWLARAGGCYWIIGQHKKGKPDVNQPFVQSTMRRENNRLGFEDATDNDYEDALVEFTLLTPSTAPIAPPVTPPISVAPPPVYTPPPVATPTLPSHVVVPFNAPRPAPPVYRPPRQELSIDMNRYCRENFGSEWTAGLHPGGGANDWFCQTGRNERRGMNLRMACQQQHASNEIHFRDEQDPYSWYCVK